MTSIGLSLMLKATSIPFLCIYNLSYMIHSYIATMARSKGGYIGIKEDNEGYLLEGTMATVGVLLKNGDFVVPSFDKILAGTTVIKILEFLD